MKIEKYGNAVTITREAGESGPLTAKALAQVAYDLIDEAVTEHRVAKVCFNAGRHMWYAEHSARSRRLEAESDHFSRLSKFFANHERRFERRLAPADAAARGTTVTTDGHTLRGIAAVFYNANVPGSEYRLAPDIMERINPHAFDSAISRRDDVRCLFNHDPRDILGRTSSGTLKLNVDHVGLRYSVLLPSTEFANHVKSAVRRGDVTGSSFAFRAIKQRIVTGQTDVREILDVELFDASPVTYPAYSATETV